FISCTQALILINQRNNFIIYHLWEHPYLSIKRVCEILSESLEVFTSNGLPTIVCSISKRPRVFFINIRICKHVIAAYPRSQRQEVNFILQPLQYIFIQNAFYRRRPVIPTFIIEFVKPRKNYPD